MPIVHVNMIEGRTIDQKRQLVTDITQAFVNIGTGKERVRVIIHDLPKSNLGVAGVLACDK